MEQVKAQTNSRSTANEESWMVLITAAGGRPRGRNGLFLPAREIDQARTRFLKDIFNSHGLTKLEPCLDPFSGQHDCLYLATFSSHAAVEDARDEWDGAQFDNAFMTRVFIDDIEEDKIVPERLQQSSTPSNSQACITGTAFLPAPPSNTFEEWWAKRDARHWASHQRNIEHQTGLRGRGVWLYEDDPEGPNSTSFSRMTPPLIKNKEDGRGRVEKDEPVELIDWPSWQKTGHFTLLSHTAYLIPLGNSASDESSPQFSNDNDREEKGTPGSSPTPDSPCLPNALDPYATKELAQKKDMTCPVLCSGHEAQASNSVSRKRVAPSSNGSAMEEPTSDNHRHVDEEFTQTEDTTHSVFLIRRDKEARQCKSCKRATFSSDDAAINGISSDEKDRQPPISTLFAPHQHTKSITIPDADFVCAHAPIYTDKSPRSPYNPARAHLPTPDTSPATLQCVSTAADLHPLEAIEYQYPHFVRIASEDEDHHIHGLTSDTRSPASDATATRTPEFDGRADVLRVRSTDGQSINSISSQSMVLHQPVAIRVGTPILIKLLSPTHEYSENGSPYSFEQIENISSHNASHETGSIDPEDAWYAELAAKTANGEIAVEYVSVSPARRTYNDLSIVDPQLEWFAEILTNREINNADVPSVPDHCVRKDRIVQDVAVSKPEGKASSEVIIEETIAMKETIVVDETFDEPEAIGRLVPAQDTSPNLVPEENRAEDEATEEPVLVRQINAFIQKYVNDIVPTAALNDLEENTLEIIIQPSIPAANETPDRWLKVLLLPLLSFFSQRLMLIFLRSPLLALVLIVLLSLYARRDGNGCAEQQMAAHDYGSSNER
jgi:hypothetical protein